jgi:hypothetical protein
MAFDPARYAAMLKLPSAAERFNRIYHEGLWMQAGANAETESRSGSGSSMVSTTAFRAALEGWLRQQTPQRLFDGPCGDFNYMRHVRFPGGWSYIGGDIVPAMIADLQKQFPERSPLFTRVMRLLVPRYLSRRFTMVDLIVGPFPAADIWLCRDCLFHLSYADVLSVLRNFLASPAHTALITNHPDTPVNNDITTGDFRPIDLTKAPFNLPQPATMLADEPTGSTRRYVGIWTRTDIEHAVRTMTNNLAAPAVHAY